MKIMLVVAGFALGVIVYQIAKRRVLPAHAGMIPHGTKSS